MNNKPNIVFILADQLRASALSIYDEKNINTPNIDKLAEQGVVYENSISNCPVCTPYRAMLLTGKYPQTTGHIINFVNTRYDEIGWGDIYKKAGYSTGYVGKWHLHTGSFPTVTDAIDFVPEGRSRLGFDYFRAYNFHMNYFNGSIATNDWHCENWEGYETKGLMKYVDEFIDSANKENPFCLFVSPHQPHVTPNKYAPEHYYEKLGDIELPPNVPDEYKEESTQMYRHYLAMTLAFDEMVGDIDKKLTEHGLNDNTIVVVTSDHGTQGGSHNIHPWSKKMPWEESIHTPFIMRWPKKLEAGTRNDTVFGAADILPSFMSMCGIDLSIEFEGNDLSEKLLSNTQNDEDEDVFIMNFINDYDYATDGNEWRGVRTKRYTYAKWLDGREILYDNQKDKYQQENLVECSSYKEIKDKLQKRMLEYMKEYNDELVCGSYYNSWYDNERRVIKNSKGDLPHPEKYPDLLLEWENAK